MREKLIFSLWVLGGESDARCYLYEPQYSDKQELREIEEQLLLVRSLNPQSFERNSVNINYFFN